MTVYEKRVNNEEPVSLWDNRQVFNVLLQDTRTYLPVKLDPRYGRIVARQVEIDLQTSQIKIFQNLTLNDCDSDIFDAVNIAGIDLVETY